MAHRELVCACGHLMSAADDDALYPKVRRHVDEYHPDLNLSPEDIRELIRSKAYDG